MESDIWVGNSTKKSEKYAMKYAMISLPWTFDRMRYDSTQKSINKRLTNIFHGVLNQSILGESLSKQGLKASLDWTKYRESDIFDFKIGNKVFDVKTVNVYEDYNESYGRRSFSTNFLIKNVNYYGSEWEKFFPCLITVSQITPGKNKDGYIFGIAVSDSDPNKKLPSVEDNGYWVSGPFGKSQPFFQDRNLIRKREEAGSGFTPVITWNKKQSVIFGNDELIEITLNGEWMEKPVQEIFTLELGSIYNCKLEFSSLTSIHVDKPYLLDPNPISIGAINNLGIEVPKRNDPTVNVNELTETWEVTVRSFTNFKVPERYELHWLGFTSFRNYIKKFQDYPSYFCPLPSFPRNNQEARVNSSIVNHFKRIDKAINKLESPANSGYWPKFEDLITGNRINAGVLLSAQRPSGQVLGAGSYYYPGSFSFHESALYILPSDLYKLSKLRDWIKTSN